MFTSSPGRDANYSNQHASLSVTHLKHHMSILHRILSMRVLTVWPGWLSLHLTTTKNVMYFWFCGRLVTPHGTKCTLLLQTVWKHYALFASVVYECIRWCKG